jgi:DNA-binding Lrp family transcriptional regulator
MSSPRRQTLRQEKVDLSAFERLLINQLQEGFPLTPQPFHDLALQLHCEPEAILATIEELLERGVLTRFGPLLNIEQLGGVFSLCALEVPEQRFEEVTAQVNGFDEVAHNYRRQHSWNMWFVLAADSQQELEDVFNEILRVTACPGLNLPKEKEFYVGLRLEA